LESAAGNRAWLVAQVQGRDRVSRGLAVYVMGGQFTHAQACTAGFATSVHNPVQADPGTAGRMAERGGGL